jgi:predicted ATPase/DNA-binding SARP family transcriptional activator
MRREAAMIRVLGPLEVDVDGETVTLGSARQRALLAVLVLQANTVVSTDQVADAIWGEDLPDAVRNTVQTTVARLRRSLGPVGRSLVTRPPGYVLVLDADELDAVRFERLVRDARACSATDPVAAAALLDDALALWRGPAYGEFAAGFARPAAVRLEELRTAAQLDRASVALRLGDVDDAVARAEDLVASDPLRERPVELLARALHAARRPADALAVLRDHREQVAEELGLDPSPALQELATRLLRDELPVAAGPPDRPVAQLPGPVGAGPAADGTPPSAPRTNVRPPRRGGRLIGRDQELAALEAALAPGRVVTVDGPGGVGKTRLAIEVLHRALAAGGSAWWVDLATVREPAGVLTATAEATGVELEPDADAAMLVRGLASRDGLLVLDNAEHLLEPLAALLDALVGTATRLRVLVTTRERVALEGEVVHHLRPLPTTGGVPGDRPAVQLFVARSTRFDPDRLDAAELAEVAELCQRLDGLPLAIELAAARADTLGLRDVRTRLDHRLDVLGGGTRTAGARHRRLRDVIDWSHDLLAPDERVLFRRLAVFPGTFSLGQVEAVCADGQLLAGRDCADVLARLIERSLVQADDGRFLVLETLRTYAAERLAADEPDPTALERRHAQDTAQRAGALARTLWGPDEADAVARFVALLPDLRRAWSHARDHDPSLAVDLAAAVHDYAYHRQRFELLDWGVEAVALGGGSPRLPRALAAAAAISWARGDLGAAADLAARGAAMGDDPEAGAALELLADVTMLRGDTDGAVRCYDEAGALRRRHGLLAEELIVRSGAAAALAYAGRLDEADGRLAELEQLARRCVNPSGRAYVAYAVGEVTGDRDPTRALAALDEAIALATPVDDRLVAGIARTASVSLAARSGPPARALARFAAVLDHWEQAGNDVLQWTLLRNLVVLLARIEDDVDAAVLVGATDANRPDKPDYGVEAERLAEATAAVRRRLGGGEFEAALAVGRAMSLPAAVAHARQVIAAGAPRGGAR